MSDELELLDQLLGGDLPLTVVVRLFSDRQHFERAVLAMLRAGDLRLLDHDGDAVPSWQWQQNLAASELDGLRLDIATQGAKRIA